MRRGIAGEVGAKAVLRVGRTGAGQGDLLGAEGSRRPEGRQLSRRRAWEARVVLSGEGGSLVVRDRP